MFATRPPSLRISLRRGDGGKPDGARNNTMDPLRGHAHECVVAGTESGRARLDHPAGALWQSRRCDPTPRS